MIGNGTYGNNVMVNVDPNYFGFGIKNNMMIQAMALQQNAGKIRLELERNVNKSNNPQDVLLNENNLVCKLGMSNSSNVITFNVKYPMTFTLNSTRKADTNDFKQGWVNIPQSNELALETTMLQNLSQNFLEARLSANFFTHVKSTQNATGNMLHYFAGRMIDENFILVELKQNANGSLAMLVKSNLKEALDGFVKTINYLLTSN